MLASDRSTAGRPHAVPIPADFAAALDVEPAARRTFEGLSYSNKSWHVLQVEGAKTDETRQRRIARSASGLDRPMWHAGGPAGDQSRLGSGEPRAAKLLATG